MLIPEPSRAFTNPPPETRASHLLRTRVLEPLKGRFAGRDELIELLGLAVTAGENLLVVGPPGTAKSQVVSEFASRIRGRYFEYLLTRFTEPSEIFGPLDLKELREGRLVTCTAGMLPEAEIAFLDEVFNASSAILNAILEITGERVFRRGGDVRRTDILSIVAAANRMPQDPALSALEDRFSLRLAVRALEDEQLEALLDTGWRLEQERLRGSPGPAPLEGGPTAADIRRLREAAAGVDLAAVRPPALEYVRQVRAAGIFLSDRRAVKLERLAAASAVLCGRSVALPSDLWPGRYLWEAEGDGETLEEITAETIARATLAEEELLDPSRPPGAAAPVHPLAAPGSRPADLLERLTRIEVRVEHLARGARGALSGDTTARVETDTIQNQLRDLDSERRWCRPRSEAEENDLRELGQRLEALSAALSRMESGEER